jgi:hypothetical protein
MDPFPDMASTWRAATQGWQTVNGYSGYAPNYYTALTLAARNADDRLFAPFQRDRELHVVVSDAAPELKAAVERQPGVVMTARRFGSTQYRLPRRGEAPDVEPSRRVPIVSAQSACAGAAVSLSIDGDERSRWECLESPELHWLTIDLGRPVAVTAVVYSVGPHSWNVPTELLIEASADGIDWRLARRGSILGELIEGGIADPDSLRAVLHFPSREARYVRLRPVGQPADFGWFVSEVEVRAR